MLIVKVKSENIFQHHPEAKNEVFLDLADKEFSCLICEESSQQLSQTSSCSERASSQRSELELEVPSSEAGPEDMEVDSQDIELVHEVDVGTQPVHSRKRKSCDDKGDMSISKRGNYKTWGELSDDGKRKRTDELYAKLLEIATESEIEPHELAAYLGKPI